MHSHEHASLSRVLFRCEYACLLKLCFLTCLFGPLNAHMFLPWIDLMI